MARRIQRHVSDPEKGRFGCILVWAQKGFCLFSKLPLFGGGRNPMLRLNSSNRKFVLLKN
jgi:hypothetical protein